MRNRTFIATLFLVFVFALSGCGGGEAESGDQTSSTQNDQANTSGSTSQNNTSQASNNEDSSTSTSGNAGDGVLLRMNLSEGQSYLMQISTTDTSTESAFGQTVERMTTTEMDLRYDVTQVMSNGNTSLMSTYERYKTVTEAGGASLEFDSENPPSGDSSPEAKVFNSLIGESFTVTMGPRGNVIELQGMDDWLSQMMGEVDPSLRQMIEPAFEGIFGEEALISLIELAFPMYPEGPIGVGDTWENRSRLNTSVPFEILSEFTLESISGGVATLSISAALSLNPDAEPIAIGPVEMSYARLEGTQEGTLNVDIETGWITSGEITQTFEGELQISGDTSEIALDNEPIPVTGTSTITYESTEIPGEASDSE